MPYPTTGLATRGRTDKFNCSIPLYSNNGTFLTISNFSTEPEAIASFRHPILTFADETCPEHWRVLGRAFLCCWICSYVGLIPPHSLVIGLAGVAPFVTPVP